MKITATCGICRRDLLLSQLVEGPVLAGRCSWCGTLLAPHSTLLLAGTVRRAEDAGTELERLGEHWARLHVRPESVLDPSGPSCSAQRRRCTASVSVEPPESQVEAWM